MTPAKSGQYLCPQPRSHGVEGPLTLQLSIAMCTGMLLATLIPSVRKSIPRPLENLIWTGLVISCVLGVLSVTNPSAREVTSSAFWAIGQVFRTLIALLVAGAVSWVSDHRMVIATAALLLCTTDALVLVALHARRDARGRQPRVRLREWMEVPAGAVFTAEPVRSRRTVRGEARRSVATVAMGAASGLTWLANGLIWTRDVIVPQNATRLAHAAAAGRLESRARLESIRDTAQQLHFAARSWYAAAGAPAVNGLAARAGEAARNVSVARLKSNGELATGRVADIEVLLNAKTDGWYGPMGPVPMAAQEEDHDGSEHADRLAS
jgi:hypothetical protein